LYPRAGAWADFDTVHAVLGRGFERAACRSIGSKARSAQQRKKRVRRVS